MYYGDNLDLKSSVPSGGKLKGACSGCVGYIKDCKYCGQKIEILEGKVLDYHAGSPHRCRGRY